ncbi:hypothetical protein [Acinetobacter sp.]|uniref:hypothetical protein n=1 Tax=Acinetobacter sp. TaxID=472 RepID=UPI00389114BD
MLWKDSNFFYAVIVHGQGETQRVEEFPQHENPFLAVADVRKRLDGLTYIRNESGASCFPHKALRYFERRAKDRGKEAIHKK